jgi:DNA helicase HerA-like ATPase
MEAALAALRKVNFDWTAHIDEIWVDQPHETDQLQSVIRAELEDYLDDLRDNASTASPLGIPLLGPAGSGKTHLLGVLRRQALLRKMYFILVDMTDVADFWETVSLGYLRSLQQPLADGRRQVDHWLDRMIALFGQSVRKANDIPKQRPPALINRAEELIAQVRTKHRAEVQEHVDVLRALILFACDHTDINDLGYKWLQGLVIDDEELGVFGFRQKNQSPSRIVRGISWLLSLTGSAVLALDQLDAIVAEHELSRGDTNAEGATEQQRRSSAIIQGIASGLLELRDLTRRSLCVVSSLEATWDILDRQATVSMADRFDSKLLLKPGTGPAVYKELVIRRLAPAFTEHGFAPPYASYPYADTFFERYRHNTPRELLKACEAHRKLCRKTRILVEAPSGESNLPPPPPPPDWFSEITKLVDSERSNVDPNELTSDDSEALQDKLVEALCEALVIENPVPESVLTVVDKDFMGTGSYDPLHARVRLILTNEQERERHHSFRYLEKSHHSAFQARLKAALTSSGVDEQLSFRGLTIIRRSERPSGAATAKLIAEFEARGGKLVAPSERDLATLLAIKRLLGAADEPEHFEEWLQRARPVSTMECFAQAVETLFRAVRAKPVDTPTNTSTAAAPAAPAVSATSASSTAAAAAAPSTAAVATPPEPASTFLPIGRRLAGGELQELVGIELDRVPYHTCVFAGSGSGKTVFLKRVIEEAALLGIPSIVLDGANDLSRLGVPWAARPSGFTDEDARKAELYHAKTEVVVWTPGAASGNPMRLNPLPDFAAFAGSGREREAELNAAIEVATSSIGDMIIKQRGSAAVKQTAILKGTLRYFAARGGTIKDLVALLREPPEDVTDAFEKGDKLARELSELLHAEIQNDPLIGGTGTPLEPSVLFRASDPAKTRVSVLSLVGLPSYDQKRRFVDQLASTLFSWIKKNPAPPGGILGLLVIDEAKDFVPSGKAVPGKENVIRLAAQARKYGLGLLFATQEPKSIEHTIVSNCSTLLGGKMSSPTAIDALQQLLSDKGTRATDVGSLKPGFFYFGTGSDKPRKVATSLCLSYHPSTPPSESEVLETARCSAR